MNEFTTKEGIEVKVGQVWRALDYREAGRHVRVVEVGSRVVRVTGFNNPEAYALVARCRPDGSDVSDRTTALSVRRMHKHSTGWALVKDVE
jgi:hypothetical protein